MVAVNGQSLWAPIAIITGLFAFIFKVTNKWYETRYARDFRIFVESDSGNKCAEKDTQAL